MSCQEKGRWGTRNFGCVWKKSKMLSIVQHLHLVWLNVLLPTLRCGCQDHFQGFRMPKCGNDSISLRTVVTPFPRELDTTLWKDLRDLLYRTHAQSCTVLSFLGGIYVYALYAQGDIKGYTAFSGGKKKVIVVLNLSLNLELSVWIQPSGNHCKRIRLSLEHRCDLMIILLSIFKKKGSNLPFRNIIQSCLSAHFRKHRACYWSLSQNVGCLELAVLGNSSLHFQLLHLLLEDKQQYVKCFLNVCFY